jgi:hypothetical protein
MEHGLLLCYLSMRLREDFDKQYEKLEIYDSRMADSFKNLWK